jgi:hypothetical protein
MHAHVHACAHAHTHTFASAVLPLLENTSCGRPMKPDKHKTITFEPNFQSRGKKFQRVRFAEHDGWNGNWNMGLHQKLLHEAGVTRPNDMVQDPVIFPFGWFPLPNGISPTLHNFEVKT